MAVRSLHEMVEDYAKNGRGLHEIVRGSDYETKMLASYTRERDFRFTRTIHERESRATESAEKLTKAPSTPRSTPQRAS